mgnify:CR=1 FL=1
MDNLMLDIAWMSLIVHGIGDPINKADLRFRLTQKQETGVRGYLATIEIDGYLFPKKIFEKHHLIGMFIHSCFSNKVLFCSCC